MDIETQLMQKNGLVAMKLARELIMMHCHDRIATIDEYSKEYGTGRGTVQSALKLLVNYKAIALEAKGHLGTYITNIDYEMLWKFTGLGIVMGVMPLPYTRAYEGLATGLFNILHEKKIPFSLAYMRGAQTRLNALKFSRYDFAVVSALAADVAMNEGLDIDICVNFGKYTYVNAHVLVFSDDYSTQIEDGMKIGVDRSSIDQTLLTESECRNKKIQLVDLAYNQIITKLKNGEIQAAILNSDEIIERKLDIKYYPLRDTDKTTKATEAVIVVSKDNFGLKNLFASLIEKERVVDYQQQVVAGDIIPNY
jgi:hypothetical protein